VSRAGFALLPGVFDLLVTPLMRAGGLSRERVAPHDGNVFEPHPDGDALHGRWGRHWLRAVAAAGTTAALGTVAEARRRTRPGGTHQDS
jgi:hypothetical protein